MKISATTYFRNAIQLDYPFIESIKSLIDWVDEYIVVVGDSTDGTREAVEALNHEKIKIVDTTWDMSLRKGGKVFAQQADIGTKHATGDWVIHLQADQVFHEKDMPTLKAALEKYHGDRETEGLLLPFLNFHGCYSYLHTGRTSYRYEVKAFKNTGNIRAYRDSQGFRKYSHDHPDKGEKLRVAKVNVSVYHYAYTRPPKVQLQKNKALETFFHDDDYLKKTYDNKAEADYNEIDKLELFTGTHPAAMEERIKNQNWVFRYDPSKQKTCLRHRLLNAIEKLTGYRLGEYKNYKLLKK